MYAHTLGNASMILSFEMSHFMHCIFFTFLYSKLYVAKLILAFKQQKYGRLSYILCQFDRIDFLFKLVHCDILCFQPVNQSPKEFSNGNLPTSLLMPHLQNLFQQTAIQQVKQAVLECVNELWIDFENENFLSLMNLKSLINKCF